MHKNKNRNIFFSELGHQEEAEEAIIKGEGGRGRLVLLLPLRNLEVDAGDDDADDPEFEAVSLLLESLVNACFSPSHCLSSIL